MAGAIIPRNFKNAPKEFWGIISATWHLSSFLAFAIAAILFTISQNSEQLNNELTTFTTYSFVFPMIASSLLVFFGTKAKHHGWITLLIIVVLLFIGSR